ncbi:hypothetical protein B0H14DRAFT_2920392 [Mycena olivaceomarginata]|nr:hypothetical protein B0H14DRAFT_2943268 [Mycena olivaceomarginata]KAJ7795255.1 hypothetical protein B0H14DRAFT_2920392 [Mycena olivaceomarginata]
MAPSIFVVLSAVFSNQHLEASPLIHSANTLSGEQSMPQARYTETINASCSPSSSSPLSYSSIVHDQHSLLEGFNIAQQFLLCTVHQRVPG